MKRSFVHVLQRVAAAASTNQNYSF